MKILRMIFDFVATIFIAVLNIIFMLIMPYFNFLCWVESLITEKKDPLGHHPVIESLRALSWVSFGVQVFVGLVLFFIFV